MGHLGSATNNPFDSDSDDDDYVPPQAEEESGSDSSDSEREAEKPAPVAEEENKLSEEEKKKARDALWAGFQASLAEPTPRPPSLDTGPKMVKIERRYRFAGDETVEIIEVPEDSPEAARWPRWKDPNAPETVDAPTDTPASNPTSTPVATDSTSSVPLPPATSKPLKRPGPRKPKTALSAIPGPSKAKKLTTLDKSALDWQAHIQREEANGSTLQDELEANRRTGGYLDKVDFLKRVEERKGDTLEALKSNKRRKL